MTTDLWIRQLKWLLVTQDRNEEPGAATGDDSSSARLSPAELNMFHDAGVGWDEGPR